MNDQNYDVIVIGTGPGGEGAAMKAAKDALFMDYAFACFFCSLAQVSRRPTMRLHTR